MQDASREQQQQRQQQEARQAMDSTALIVPSFSINNCSNHAQTPHFVLKTLN
jgi:hypothetical protein